MDKLHLLFEELCQGVDSCSKAATLQIRGDSRLPVPPDLEEAYGLLRKLLESEQAIAAFEQASRQICFGAMNSLLYVLDGNTDLVEHFFVQLIDADTKEDLRPEDGDYVGEFTYYVLKREHGEGE